MLLATFVGKKKRICKKRVRVVDRDGKNYDHSSNLIWHYMDANDSDKNTSKWFRNNFALMHSLGGCLAAIILGTAICLVKAIWYHFHDCCFIGYWLACVAFLSLIICKYRNELKSRYLARLRIYILSHKVAIQNCENEKHTNKENTRFSGRFRVH